MIVIWSIGAAVNAGRRDQAERSRQEATPVGPSTAAARAVRAPDPWLPRRSPDPPPPERPRFPTRVQRLQARFDGRALAVEWDKPEHHPDRVAGYEVQVAPRGQAAAVSVRTKRTSARLDVPDLRRAVYEVSVFTLSRERSDTSGVCFGRVSKREVAYRGPVSR